ncbi:MAG: serine hydrolase [Albidovulum sp.]
MTLTSFGAIAAPYADFVIDARTGQVLHQKNADTRLHPASLTKMMTLYIAFEAIEHGEISLDTMVTISKYAASQPPSRLGLKAGQRIALRYLIRAAAIKSANDAAAAIGDAIEGDRAGFAKRMNRTAKMLGMTKTTFHNANGLTAKGHLSTARDMTTLGRRVFYDYPQYYNLFSRRSADAGMATVNSTNRRFLGAYEGADGIKTGYTNAAGFNLVASAKRGNKRVIATVFGGTSTAQRNARVAELLDMGFGKAPNRVKEKRPAAIAYLGSPGEDEPPEDFLANAVAGSVNSDAPAAGKILRLNVAVTKSPRPRGRPDAPALGESQPMMMVDTAPAPAPDLAVATDEVILADAAEMVAATDDLMAAIESGVNLALADIDEPSEEVATGFVQSTAPQPESLALADADPVADPVVAAPVVEPTVIISASASAPASAPRPQTRPTAELPADNPELAEVALEPAPAEVVAALPDAAAPTTAEAATPETAGIAQTDTVVTDTVVLAKPDNQATDTAAQEIVLTAQSAVEAAETEQEVVTKVSTSGGRGWGINVGAFPSRFTAEHQLLRTALVEMGTLNDAQTAVRPRKGAFEANFVGLSQETAEMACRRLAARGTECLVLNPGA